jgi:hypothetical protein
MKKEASADSTLLVLGAGASIGAAKYPIESSLREAMAKMPSGPNFFHDPFVQGRMDGKKQAAKHKTHCFHRLFISDD